MIFIIVGLGTEEQVAQFLTAEFLALLAGAAHGDEGFENLGDGGGLGAAELGGELGGGGGAKWSQCIVCCYSPPPPQAPCKPAKQPSRAQEPASWMLSRTLS